MRPSDATLLDKDVGRRVKTGGFLWEALLRTESPLREAALPGLGLGASGDGPGMSYGVSLHSDGQGRTWGTIRSVGLAWRKRRGLQARRGHDRFRELGTSLPFPDPFTHLLDVGFGRRMKVLFAHEISERLPHLGVRVAELLSR